MNTEINKVLLYFALKYNGNFDKIYSSLRTKEKFDVDEFMKLKKYLNTRNQQIAEK